MENAADALKIAFAIFVFVLAITITFSVISHAKSTADVVLYYSDKTNFYDHTASSSNSNRQVSVTEVISTLYRYYKESISVTVDLGAEGVTTFDLSNSSSSITQIENNLKIYIANLLTSHGESKFTEEFVEVPISGIYETGDDDTQITLSSGGKKVYVTYTLDPST